MPARTALITGAGSGLGLETAHQLLANGMQVVVVTRDERSAAATRQRLQSRAADPDLVLPGLHADLLLRQSGPDLVDQVAAGGRTIDVLINNAGAAFDRYQETGDGVERTHAVNHHAPFLLTHRLLAAGLLAEDARIVNISSGLERKGQVDPAQPDVLGTTWRDRFAQTPVYGTSKLLSLLATRELARRLPARTRVYSAIPGVARTGFMTKAGGSMARLSRLAAPFLLSPEKASATGVLLATSPAPLDPQGGVFAKARPVPPSRTAQDDTLAAQVYLLTAASLGLEPLAPTRR